MALPQPRHLLFLLFCLAIAGSVWTQSARSEIDARTDLLDRAQAAVVGVFSEAVENAGSIATRGAVRRGAGVVIGDDGLVLTIGYVTLEAERVDLIIKGFGLLQVLAPPHVAPVELSLAHLVSQRSFSGHREYRIDAALLTVPPRGDHSGAAPFNLNGELWESARRS